MDYSLYDFLKLIGSLGFFLFGMKLMSESLQKVAGDKMRTILGTMTKNKMRGILTGLLITSVIQSSSATTVMVVSFVNAGLLSLVQSISVIMGANIGTTVTAWLFSLLGFKVDISMFALPIIGFAIPLMFSKITKRRSYGELIIGFAILFMGLAFLKNSVPDIKSNPEILSFITQYSSYGFGSVIIFLVIGTVLTIIIQSSSAVMALTLIMCFNGWINFEMAVAMVMGENIGTTITANLAAIVVNDTAKRSARAHFVFNITGVILMLMFLKPFVRLIDSFLVSIGQLSPLNIEIGNNAEHHVVLPIALSVFHTSFNVLNTLLQVWFIPYIAKLVTWMVPSKEDDDEIFRLKYINSPLVSVNEFSIIQAKNEISVFVERTKKMYTLVKNLYNENKQPKIEKYILKIRRYEEISDRIDEEITSFLSKVTLNDPSQHTSENSNLMLRLVSRIESINDSCTSMAEFIYTWKTKKIEFTNEMKSRLDQLFSMIDVLFSDLNIEIDKSIAPINIEMERDRRDKIESYIEKMNAQHLKDIKKGKYKPKTGIIYCDIFNEGERTGNHIYHALKYMHELII
ncbi:MAG: Na/Pi cotransporter family protein [Prolixibacteraceae bacterium]|nr:Na/Pi cotransporter family protein [Prolixibacteraceae bacterium]